MSEGVLDRPRVLAIVGPTAVGKSAVAEALGGVCAGEVISADSMQVYRGMDIGTAKEPPAKRSVPYHCIDLVEPGTPYSAALYQRDARRCIDDIAGRGKTPIMAGGTGLYVRAALDDLQFPAGETDSDTREEVEAELRVLGPDGLHALLEASDPAAAALIHPHNARRVVRALEMLRIDGVSYADVNRRLSERRSYYPTTMIGLEMDRSALYVRIDARVDAMIRAYLLEEVRGLLDAGYRDALTAAQAIGYKELVPVIDGVAELQDAVDDIKRASRRYAKRQLTWFRADPRISWIDVTDLSPDDTAERVSALVEST